MTLSELQVLNEELIAAIRSGVSIDLGLRDSSQHLSGRLSLLAEQLAQHLSDGKSLPESLAALEPAPPVVYQVVVAAGLRGNQLEAVLIRLNEHARIVSELRESLWRASVYPISLCGMTYLITVFSAFFCVPPLRSLVTDMKLAPSLPVRLVYAVHDTLPYWAIGIPGLIACICLGGFMHDRWKSGTAGSFGLLRYLPGFRRMMHNADLSRLASLLAMQAEYGLPLPESLRRSAEAVEAPQLRAFCIEAAGRIERGETFGDSLAHSRVVPPFMKWMLSVPSSQQALVQSALQASEVYRERTILLAEWIERIAPVVVTLGFASVVVGLYCWAVMGSLVSLWNGIPT